MVRLNFYYMCAMPIPFWPWYGLALALCRHGTSTAWVLRWCYISTALALITLLLVLRRYYTVAALVLNWYCTVIVLVAYWCCMDIALVLHLFCAGPVLVSHWESIESTLVWYCTEIVRRLLALQ